MSAKVSANGVLLAAVKAAIAVVTVVRCVVVKSAMRTLSAPPSLPLYALKPTRTPAGVDTFNWVLMTVVADALAISRRVSTEPVLTRLRSFHPVTVGLRHAEVPVEEVALIRGAEVSASDSPPESAKSLAE